jgi:hypothetical protein
VAARSKAWTFFARSNAEIMGSNPTQSMDVCVHLFCVYVVLCVGSGLATGWSPVQGVLPTVYKIKKLKKQWQIIFCSTLPVQPRPPEPPTCWLPETFWAGALASSVKDKNEWSYNFNPHTFSWNRVQFRKNQFCFQLSKTYFGNKAEIPRSCCNVADLL